MPIQTILVVDDSPTERLALTEVLTRQGYQVVTAENGEDAIAKSAEARPDLILMDVVMPGMNGYQATRTISRFVTRPRFCRPTNRDRPAHSLAWVAFPLLTAYFACPEKGARSCS